MSATSSTARPASCASHNGVIMGWIRWTQWGEEGLVDRGEMPADRIQPALQEFAVEARRLLLKSGMDHVLYGIKIFEKGFLSTVQFYMWPMTEEQFQKTTARLRNSQVYALHKK